MPQYQGVWTLEQQAQAQSNQQWVTDPNFKNTTLLLQADGTGSGSQNQTFLDGSTNNFFITRNGNTTQGSFSPFSQAPGYWGNYFAGGSDSLNFATGLSGLAVGSNNFTVECWIYPTTTYTSPVIFQGQSDGATAAGSAYNLYIGATQSRIYVGSTTYGVNSAQPILNQWNHVAWVRNGTAWTTYLNGVQVATTSVSGSVNAGGTSVVPQLCGGTFTGYISNFSFVNGTALYTGTTYAVPTSILSTATTNQQILTCQANRFVDSNTYASAKAITTAGSPSVQAFGPFAPALQWTPDVVGGSGYFDGTGDYLTAPDNAAWYATGDWTVEAWIYPTTFATTTSIIAQWVDGGGTDRNISLTISTAGLLEIAQNRSTVNYSVTSTVSLNTWTHVAGVLNGTSLKLYVNGVSVGTPSTVAGSANNSTAPLGIGAFGNGSYPFTGYISNARFVNGTAVYTANFTPPTAPLTAVANTQLLLNYTNAGIYDGKMANNLETVGNAQVATSPVKYGSGSMYFDGANDYLLSPPGPNYNLGNGDFTIELWAYDISRSSSGTVWLCKWGNPASVGRSYILGYITSSSTLTFDMSSDGTSTTASLSTTTSGIRTGVWNHIAVSRNGNLFRLFLNGNIVATLVNSITLYTQTTLPFCIATNYEDKQSSLSAWDVNGFIDDLRITKGVCRYTANFTPPQQALPRQ